MGVGNQVVGNHRVHHNRELGMLEVASCDAQSLLVSAVLAVRELVAAEQQVGQVAEPAEVDTLVAARVVVEQELEAGKPAAALVRFAVALRAP